ncbi:hypothetical protein Taro_010581 [Colocasia esculenta]|uniref:Retrotransposon gag domain-containing protein n=1 Tax=Colocasia esculenta TaxID=4460 RepID=A0A843U7Y4_COLES|nr:hypothetical protein [Colocasia esculenta]
MEQEFLSLTQGSMTVLEYEARFSELSKYAPHIVENERRKTKKFVMGLKPSLRMRLVAFDHRTLDEALSAACRQEGEMEQYLEEKKASQKRPAATFQRQDKKKTRPDMDANTNPGVERYVRLFLWPTCAAELQASETRKPTIGGLSPTALKAVKSPGSWIKGGGFPDIPLAWRSSRSPEEEDLGGGVVGDVAPLEETVETDSERGD